MEWVHVGGTPVRMKIYFAPLEGVTTYIFRNAFAEIYGHVDKYFAPFISPSENCPLTPRERKDIAPENNRGIHLVPQILTCRSEHFIDAAKALSSMGYGEINLNLGCPSGTVCAKGKGAGFLQDKDALQSFLDDIYSYAESCGMKISVKTRLGYREPEEFYSLIEIFNLFPISELIVHPRIRTDFYKGDIRKEYFAYAQDHCKCTLVYNGNIFSVQDYADLSSECGLGGDSAMSVRVGGSAMPERMGDSAMSGRVGEPAKADRGEPAMPERVGGSAQNREFDPIMLGRGLMSDPELAGKIKNAVHDAATDALAVAIGKHDDETRNEARNTDADGTSAFAAETDFLKLRRFHDTLYHEYQKVMAPDINVLHKMRELWTYWQVLLEGKEREIKRLMKAKKYEDYEAIVYPLLEAAEESK